MKESYYEFPEAIKDIISEYGKDIMGDVRFANILSDVYRANEVPAIMKLLKKLIEDGYNNDIIKASESESWEIKFKIIETKAIKENGLDQNITSYIFDSIQYGLSLSDQKPTYKAVEYKALSMYDMELELRKLKSDYLKALEEKVESPEEGLGFFSVENQSDLYEIREKILILSKVLHKNEDNWCATSMNSVREKYYVEPIKRGKAGGILRRLFG